MIPLSFIYKIHCTVVDIAIHCSLRILLKDFFLFRCYYYRKMFVKCACMVMQNLCKIFYYNCVDFWNFYGMYAEMPYIIK